MERYKIYCTLAQTKKALELGAPKDPYHTSMGNKPYLRIDYEYSAEYLLIPTTEQMCGWLRGQGFRFRIKDLEETTHWEVTMDGWFADGELSTRQEATLAAIDAALKHLTDGKD